tara:strand:+ start:655 stop:1296 length:642 start_codon:yes stop_codon:yes gene_type:complete
MGFIGNTPTPVPLTTGDIPDLPATKITSGTFPALNGSNLTSLPAGNLTGTLPAISGANLTGISGGKILQVVGSLQDITHSTTSTTFVDSGIKVDITPSATSSKILIIMNTSTNYMDSSSVNYQHLHTLYRDVSGGSATELSHGTNNNGGFGGSYRHSVSFNDIGYEFGSNYLDSPNTTSAIEYKLFHRVGNSGHTGYLGLDGKHHMTALEIGA